MSVDTRSLPPEESAAGFLSGLRIALQHVDGARFRSFLVFLAALTAVFAGPLLEMTRYAFRRDLYSHVLLVPAISLYLFALRGPALPRRLSTSWVQGIVAGVIAISILMIYQWQIARGWKPAPVDYLARSMGSYFAFAIAGAFLFLGASLMRASAFAWAFLIFMVPFPKSVEDALEIFFQYASADAAHWLINLAGLPVFREGQMFKLPGITLEVAQECSGIRSSLVLFITSLVAGQMFLRSRLKRAILTAAVIPLAILRNGFRILTISWLCVHISPAMIDSPIHHRGGPIFFLLSLLPFFALLLVLRRLDLKSAPAGQAG
jgi:exosortase C (VPDSG-CTERM-specific)